MSNSYNLWSKIVGLPEESQGLLSESADHKSDETEIRNIVREQIQHLMSEVVLSEAKASRDQVEAIQRVLNNIMVGEEGFPIDMDGLYGPKTRDAVVAFQKAFKLGADGIVGKNTLVKMGDAMQDKIAAGGPLADANFDLATALPSPDEGIVFGYKMEPAEPALVPVPAEDEEMSNDKFVEFMEDLGLPLTSAQLAQLDVDGPEAVVGDLAAGPRSKVKAEVERISLPGLDVQQPERLGGSEYPDVADIDDIWAED